MLILTLSFYGNWGYHAPTRDTTDFETGAHNIETLFSLAKEIGLYIIFRPGPVCYSISIVSRC